MSLAKLITAELRRLSADGAGERIIEIAGADGAPSARVALFDADRYSVSLRALTVAGRQLPPGAEPGAADARLTALAKSVIAQLAYLEEPLAVVERSAADAQAQIRSNPPLREEDEALSYWEVLLTGGENPVASIARYRWEPGLPERELTPYPATFALVGRIADSLVAALAAA